MKQIFLFINIIFLTAAAYLTAQIIYKNIGTTLLYVEDARPDAFVLKSEKKFIAKQKLIKDQYEKINRRNLFNALLEEESKNVEKQTSADRSEPGKKLEASTLKLKLWGTVTGGSQIFAVIEDQNSKQQSLYQKGDTVQEAEIKEISRHRVIINFKGKDQVLEMDVTEESGKKSFNTETLSKAEIIDVDKDLIDRSLENQDDLQKQARIKPHFKDGEPDGLILYGIRPESIFNKMGLKNGDIVKEVNGTPTIMVEDAFRIYEDLEHAPSARVTIFRRGQQKDIVYHVKYGARSITTFPDAEE